MRCTLMASRNNRTRLRTTLLALFVVVTGNWMSAFAWADHIDAQLLEEAPRLLRQLKDHSYASVGVLPFRVDKRGQGPKFNVGPLNTNMASRLANALILAETDTRNPIKVVDTGKVAARSRGLKAGNDRTRDIMLKSEYPLAWGTERARPDVLLGGDVKISRDNSTAMVMITAFDGRATEPRVFDRFQVATDRTILADAGQHFQLTARQARSRDDETLDKEAAASASRADNAAPEGSKPESIPAGTAAGDVTISILCDGQPVTIDRDPSNPGEARARLGRRESAASVASSSQIQGKTIALIIENKSPTEAYAVVLLVNGCNTLFEEAENALNCTKWVLDPARDGKPTRYTIKGIYQKKTDPSDTARPYSVRPFKVLSEEESRASEVEFKDQDKLGLIEFHVFKSGSTSDKKMLISSVRKLSLRGLSLTEQNKYPVKSFQACQTGLQQHTRIRQVQGRLALVESRTVSSRVARPARRGDRGLIVGDERPVAGSQLEKVNFENPQEIYFLPIRYYTPSGSG